MSLPFYEVGGCVRDSLLGLKSKDIDFCVPAKSYSEMRAAVVARGWEVKVDEEKYLRLRAVSADLGGVDVVVCRKDGMYSDVRRPDEVSIGTLEDDLARRDFTVNALARDEQGNLIDLFGGQKDLNNRILRCVGNTEERMREDALRMLRAIRFCVMKGFSLSAELTSFLGGRSGRKNSECNADMLDKISAERIMEELKRCFAHDTRLTLNMLNNFWQIREACFRRNIKIVPTMFVDK